MHPIYPCFWLNGTAAEAAAWYLQVFPDAQITSENPMVLHLQVRGSKLMLLNGGPMYQANAAVSNFVYCESAGEIDRIYAALLPGSTVFMELGSYAWSSRYAWLVDRFGIAWQLDIDPIRAAQKIVPALLFSQPQGHVVAEAVHHYTRIFQPSRVLMESPYPPHSGMPEGALLFAQFKLHDSIFNAMSSAQQHDFQFSPGNSLVVECDTQQQIDHLWTALGAGGHYQMCGWLVDRYGLSWQIIPSILPKLMSDISRRERVVEAFMQMQKFDIQALEMA